MEDKGEAQIGFTANLPSDTRTNPFGKGKQVNTLVVGVFDEQQQEIYRKDYPITGSSMNITLILAQDQTYNFVFWAYDNSLQCYNIDDLTAIRMNRISTSVTFTDVEATDAFYAIQKNVTIKGDCSRTIELRRPLAQINIGTTGKSMQASMTAKDVPATFHPFTESVGEEISNYTWSFSETATETFTADGKEYTYLSFGYVFAPDTPMEAAVGLTLTEGEKSKTVEFAHIGIQANSRSNIAGNFTNK